ncbi:bifunctional alpha,alpha-trehalose-phosphate synthase (UDP-forming)/trehalose-phosphatase [Flavobacterium sp. TMP13]|uniref:bifunctional alpha,alpha-trehalose-phosphate synthase (UDP-forming)/trehalose-phosphatase n=1 Tax=unclassified Flavobacterium TaxID=196869 RepID=UPI00076C08EC|nr:bifunctional alpha,alpha-trehalose-phosphate synthase (UDP-forming)/trehalose-phosphatase [Flavobacterium sp. TAB 87]KVV16244.1 Trehalose-phosphate synthase [Flavobacterium sp. TAB 87]
MNKTIIVSNRLPVDLKYENSTLVAKGSTGGLATGMKSVHKDGNGIWIGWSGLIEQQINSSKAKEVDAILWQEKCVRVPLTQNDIDNYYYGFSNSALWPLFHYFQSFTEFEIEHWNAYKEVNEKFAAVILEQAKDGDTVWVHDYQLLLLPQLLRKANKNITIGFFLHIPYPSYELFKTCPWRDDLLEGMLGADLIGFHTYDYVRHFISSVGRLTNYEVHFSEIHYQNRIIKVDCFPMGIDYTKYNTAALARINQKEDSKTELMKSLDVHNDSHSDSKLILSIDRMDYTKGIANRIKSFEYFLTKYPQYVGKVRLVMLAVPSRENVPQYQRLKREIDELVGRINGEHSLLNWTPIWYFYRALPFDDLIDLYVSSDVAMVTPIRDGMNLVAKEYVATRTQGSGVLILSEMAGAAQEMHEALIVNPNNFEQIADSLKNALEMPAIEQRDRIQALQKRISRYNVELWASEFLKSLQLAKSFIPVQVAEKLSEQVLDSIHQNFKSAKKKIFLLDYDGTLAGFKNNPIDAYPDDELLILLDSIAKLENTEIAIVSGRDRTTLMEWFGDRAYTLITDHGAWLRKKGENWICQDHFKTEWKANVRPIFETFVDRTPGAFIEEKEFSIAWHYRKADAEMADLRKMEFKHVLKGLLSNDFLSVLEGNKVLEVKNSNINKGRASLQLLQDENYDFVFAIGDDWTDEFMFNDLPQSTFTVKVGNVNTAAKYYIEDISEVRPLLHAIIRT